MNQQEADEAVIDSAELRTLLDVIGEVDPIGIQRAIADEVLQSTSKMSPHPQLQGGQRPPEVVIVEQPASKALRFRYECEGRSAGSIPGVNSTPENKTFPTIQVLGYRGRAVVVVSCVTKDDPFRPHPHNLVGKEGCKKGVCTLEINNDDMTVSFSNLGIQCVKKKDIEEALRVREEIRVDPFRTGFSHKSNPSSIDLNVVRLCFQVFLEGDRGKFTKPLKPVVSDPIYDKKAMSDLTICKLSDCSSSALGGREIILLCEKVAKEDIGVRFFEERNGELIWQAYGDFPQSSVHKQVAISFKTPPYMTTQLEESVKVKIQLYRPSDHATSEALPFQYTPVDSDLAALNGKRKRPNDNMFAPILRSQSDERQNLAYQSISPNLNIKPEPRDQTPSPFSPNLGLSGGTMIINQPFDYRNPQATPSPQPPQYFQPFSVSPQPPQMTYMMPPFNQVSPASPQFNASSYSATAQIGATAAFPDPNFPLANLPPLSSNNIVTPVPIVPSVLDSGTLPAHLPNFSTNDLNMSIDPMENFLCNSGEMNRILQTNDFSTGLSSEQTRNQRDVDEKGLSDSLSRLLNN